MELYVPLLILIATFSQFLENVNSSEVYHEHSETLASQDQQHINIISNETLSETHQKFTESIVNAILMHKNVTNVTDVADTIKVNARKAKFNPDESERDLSNLDIEDTTYKLDVSINLENSEHETTIHPTTKKAKQLGVYKTRPNELLRHYVEDTNIRPPIAALVDKKLNPLMKARQLWKITVRPKAALDAMLVSYDSEGKYLTSKCSNIKL